MRIKDLAVYEAILQKSDIIFSLMDTNANYLDLTPAYEGYEDLIGKSMFEVVKPEQIELAKAHFEKCLSGVSTSFIVNSIASGGEIDWWQNTNIPISENGKTKYILSMAKNINNQMEFRKDDSLLESLLYSSPDYVSLLNENYEFIYVSRIQNAYRGIRFIGNHVKNVLGEDAFTRLLPFLKKAKSERVLVNRESEIINPNGEKRYYESRIKYNETAINEGQYLVITRDVTLEKESEALINVQQKRIDKNTKWVALGEMSAGIAHEINNPLTIIKGRSRQISRLIESGDLEKAKELLDNISNCTDRIDNIVKGLQTYSRKEVNDPHQIVNINDILSETINLYQSQIKAENIILSISYEAENLYVEGHPGEISQVILNLLNNAKDAIFHDDKKWIEIKLRADLENIYIDISNSGKKIDESIVNKIFDPFFTTKDVGKGTGLGLSLSSSIIQNHAGSLYFDSDKDFTTFTFSIPLS